MMMLTKHSAIWLSVAVLLVAIEPSLGDDAGASPSFGPFWPPWRPTSVGCMLARATSMYVDQMKDTLSPDVYACLDRQMDVIEAAICDNANCTMSDGACRHLTSSSEESNELLTPVPEPTTSSTTSTISNDNSATTPLDTNPNTTTSGPQQANKKGRKKHAGKKHRGYNKKAHKQ